MSSQTTAVTPVPIWVSRETADGVISYFAIPLWLFGLIGFLILFNVILWGGIGMFVAVKLIITAAL